MNSRNEDKLSMYNKVRLFLKDHIADISAIIPSAAAAKSDFDNQIGDLMLVAAQSGAQTTGYTQIKENARVKLEQIMLKAVRSLKAYSIDSSMPDLRAQTEYSRSEIERFRDGDLYTTALRIHGLTQVHIAALIDYAFTPANLTTLKGNITTFFEVIQLPKDKIGERSSYNKLIDIKISEIDTLLRDRLDTYMSLVEFDDVQLYEQYRSARSIDTSRGYGNSKSYKGSIAAGLTVVVVKQNYDADRTYTFLNKGNSELSFGLSTNGTDFSGTVVTLQPSDEISRDAGDLSGEGEFLLVQNLSAVDGAWEVEADK